MSSRIESLESRTFLSASTLAADEAALSADIASLPAIGTSSIDTVQADVAGQTLTKADKALGAKWAKDISARYKVVLKANTTGQKAVNKAIAKLQLDETKLAAKNTTAGQKKVTADTTKLQAAANKAQAAITADSNTLQTANANDLSAIGAALPDDAQLQSDIVTINATVGTQVSTIQADTVTVFTTDVNAIIAV